MHNNQRQTARKPILLHQELALPYDRNVISLVITKFNRAGSKLLFTTRGNQSLSRQPGDDGLRRAGVHFHLTGRAFDLDGQEQFGALSAGRVGGHFRDSATPENSETIFMRQTTWLRARGGFGDGMADPCDVALLSTTATE